MAEEKFDTPEFEEAHREFTAGMLVQGLVNGRGDGSLRLYPHEVPIVVGALESDRRLRSAIKNMETRIRVCTESLEDFVKQGGNSTTSFAMMRNIDSMMTKKKELERILNG